MFTNHRNSRVLKEIGIGEHDGDVKFLTGSRNMAVLRMRNKKYAIQPIFTPESPNSYVLQKIGVGERHDDVRFLTGSRNMAV